MTDDCVLYLADYTEFRQTLQARPPRVVHGTVILLAGLLASAVLWAALTGADLVIRATGRVRPVTPPQRVFGPGGGEVVSALQSGRVAAVCFREGQEVKAGDVLIRLNTERLDHEIAKQVRAVRAAEDELAGVMRLQELAAGQFEAARAKAEQEVAQALEEVRQARE